MTEAKIIEVSKLISKNLKPFFSWEKESVIGYTEGNKVFNKLIVGNEKYIFKSNPCGICVIISNNFSNTKIERKGTKIDLDRLDKTFSKLNFKVIKKEDKTDKEIYQIIEKYGKKKVDCFVCCILSHGDEEKVFGNDNSPLTFNEMRSAISKNQENLLKGKPKIFFIQACQGPNAANQYVESDSINQYVESDLREELNLTENEDFYFSVCTTPGHISYRYSHYGTIYIQTLCDLLISNVSMQLVDILTKLNFEMRRQMITHPSLISLRNPTGLAINISNTVFNTLDKGVFFEIKK
ncbi:caspase-8 [Hydra vulgaris]|uniref:caspase-8 n=1 Tax=Hydra vulgaris TaxID=6087 RepID=UPI0032EA8AD0